MKKTSSYLFQYVGMDVHKKTIAFCVYDPMRRCITDERELPHDLSKVRKYLSRIQENSGEIQACYEASSCGYGLYRELNSLEGIFCDVIAPSMIPRRAGDHQKTDRRDAQELATLHAAGLLTKIHVPDESQEAVRSLLRCRGDLVETVTCLKQRIQSFLQARGFQYPGKTAWTKTFRTWVYSLSVGDLDQITLHTYLHQLEQMEQEVLRLESELAKEADRDPYRAPVKVLMAFRGVRLITALTVVFELGDIRRFAHPRPLMSYLGLTPREYSSGERTKRGGITKTGNVHVRTALISTGWKYANRPRCSRTLKERQQGVTAEVVSISWRAQNRLYKRFHQLCKSNPRCVANPAIVRELVSFFWEALQVRDPLIKTTPA